MPRRVDPLWLLAVACALAAPAVLAQTPVGTAFTYEGRLTDNGAIVIGSDGFSVISYIDNTADSLKVARCGTRSSQ